MKTSLRKLNLNDWQCFAKWWRNKELIDLTSGDHTFLSDKEIRKQTQEMIDDQIIYVEVRPENLRAVNLYQKLGFKDLGLKKYPNNPNLPEVTIMEKEI